MSNLENLRFVHGQAIKAADFNPMREKVLQSAEQHQVSIDPIDPFEDGHVLCSKQMNALKDGVTRISTHLGFSPQWSFSPFKDGDVLHAKPVDEILQQLLRIS